VLARQAQGGREKELMRLRKKRMVERRAQTRKKRERLQALRSLRMKGRNFPQPSLVILGRQALVWTGHPMDHIGRQKSLA